jgi:hypothetical protein
VLLSLVDNGTTAGRWATTPCSKWGFRSVGTVVPSRTVNRMFLRPYNQTRSQAMTFTLNAAMLQPIVALLAGILILFVPRILNFVVAIYLIFVGVTGLWPHLLSALPH